MMIEIFGTQTTQMQQIYTDNSVIICKICVIRVP